MWVNLTLNISRLIEHSFCSWRIWTCWERPRVFLFAMDCHIAAIQVGPKLTQSITRSPVYTMAWKLVPEAKEHGFLFTQQRQQFREPWHWTLYHCILFTISSRETRVHLHDRHVPSPDSPSVFGMRQIPQRSEGHRCDCPNGKPRVAEWAQGKRNQHLWGSCLCL